YDLPDADLFLPALGGERRQSEQAETGNEYSKAGKVFCQRGNTNLCLILLLILVVQEPVGEWKARVIGHIDIAYRGQRFLLPSGADPDHDLGPGIPVSQELEECRFDRLVE